MSLTVRGCVCIDLADYQTLAETAHGIRRALDGLRPGTAVRIDVPAGMAPMGLAPLFPPGVLVQVNAPDGFTAAGWEDALNAAGGDS